jgi:sugar lactone lactonase YvrE
METVLESQTKISSPAFDNAGLLYFCSPETGDINLVDGTEIQTVGNTNGVPNSVTFDSNNTMYICDLARQAIRMYEFNFSHTKSSAF